MALSKGLLLVFATLLALSLTQSTLASYSPYSDEEEEPKHKKVRSYGGKKFYKKKHYLGYHYGKPEDHDDDEDDDTRYYSHDDDPKKPVYKKPVYKKPYVKDVKKPVYKKPYKKYDGEKEKLVYKKPYKPSYPVKKPVYTKPYKPSYPVKKPVYKPKPKYKLPVYEKPAYTKPDSEPVYDDTEPEVVYEEHKPYYRNPYYKKPEPEEEKDPKPYYKKPEPEEEEEPKPYYKKPYYKKPEEQYQPEKPKPMYGEPEPEKPAYSPARPSSSSEGEWLEPHNAARAEVGLPPLVWSDEVAQFAESWANQRRAAGCGLEHSGGSYGENIFWGSGAGYGPAECVASWVREKENYNYGDNSCSSGDCGHYTQIIWANTARLGCAKATCDDGSVFMTCNYDPPGNYIGTKPY
ncbi:hypothetical protein GOP47_0004670 [Adiantum capillus-veneris]|uniref:SCP domain-containing protein n=1 Tax=Adiantum capillus-veneris TaxID=13818 RepID=A0A9D4ZPT4_ADICA|nr:hypothetical protein GOP47_0004670 [Adiantum capillus-veneris]